MAYTNSKVRAASYLADGAVQVNGGLLLGMDGDDVSASLGKVGNAELRLHNHLRS
jgi:hypothetical protein